MDHRKVTESTSTLRCCYYVDSIEDLSQTRAIFSYNNRLFYLYKECRGFSRHAVSHTEMKSIIHVIVFEGLGMRIENIDEYTNLQDSSEYSHYIGPEVEDVSSSDGIVCGPPLYRKYNDQCVEMQRVLPRVLSGKITTFTLLTFKRFVDRWFKSDGSMSYLLTIPIKSLYFKMSAYYDLYLLTKDVNLLQTNCCPSVVDYVTFANFNDYLKQL